MNNLWRQWEPRVPLPVFSDFENNVNFVVNATFDRLSLKNLARPAYYLAKKKMNFGNVLRSYKWLLLSQPLQFRGIYLNRQGELIKEWKFDQKLVEGDLFKTNVNELCREAGIKLQDGVFILVANRGRTDLFLSSPGSVSMNYSNDRIIAGFRTGFFARSLNEKGKTHYGFTGLNPEIFVDENLVPGWILVNHSSDPQYDRTVTPTVRLHRTPEEYLEASFGEIKPHGAVERTLYELFPNAKEFLGEKGQGYSVIKVKGSTLASYHVIRSRDGRTMAIEHSRPAHTNVVDYLKKRKQ